MAPSLVPPPPEPFWPLIRTVTSLALVPPGPVQLNVNLLSVVSGPTVCVPVIAFVPDHAPEAAQLVAPVDDQESTEEPPEAIEVALAVRVTVGATGVSSARRP